MVGVELAGMPSHLDLDDSLAELALLTKTAGVAVIGSITQRLETPNSATFIGTGNAGAVGSMSTRSANGGGAPAQLLGVASLVNLEALYQARGLDTGAVVDDRALQAPWREATDEWLRRAAPAVALAVHNAACLLDLEGVIVDGSFGRGLLGELLGALDGAMDRHDWEGVARPALLAGTIGSDARAIGGAWLPLYAAYAPDSDLFLKLEA